MMRFCILALVILSVVPLGRCESLLTVSGHGEDTERPDIAKVSLGVESQTNTAESAQDAVNGVMQQVLTKIKAVGIPDNEIQTAGVNLSPVYSTPQPGQENQPPHIAAYRASNQIRVRTTHLKLVGAVIDAGLKAGANRLEGIEFGLANDLHSRTEVLKQAAHEAQAKGQALADALGLKLVAVKKVNESAVNLQPPRPLMAMWAEVAATPVQPGKVKVDASISVEFKIESNK